MNLSKTTLLLFVLIAGSLAIGGISANNVFAQNAMQSNYSSVINKLSERFNLNKDDVIKVFEEVRSERQAIMLRDFEDRLNQAVNDGKITQDQKKMILERHNEMRATMNELKNKNLSKEEFRQEMQKIHSEFRDWAEKNGININALFGKRISEKKRFGFRQNCPIN